MQSENIWVSLRGMMMIAGSVLATVGFIKAENVIEFNTLATAAFDALSVALPAIVAFGAFCWANYIRWKTKSVPLKTALRADVPTISAATGQQIPGTEFTPDTHPELAKVANS